MKKNTVIVSLKLLVGLFAISLILMPANAQAKNIKVGVIDCYSGPPAAYGTDTSSITAAFVIRGLLKNWSTMTK